MPDGYTVDFSGALSKELGESAPNVDVVTWFADLAGGGEPQLMGGVEGAGTGFAFPTRTVHVVSS